MALAGSTCLVTGAGGFLGQRIVSQLLEEDEGLAEVRALDRTFSSDTLQNFQKVKTKTLLTIIEGDIRDAALLQTAVRGVAFVIHSACIIDVWGHVDYQTLWDINVRGTQLLLEACLHNGVQGFIYTSSIEAAGPNSKGDPVYNGDEDTEYQTTKGFPYPETKREAEKIVLESDGVPLKNGHRFVTCALRPMYIFGEESRFFLASLDESIQNKNVFLRKSRKEALVNPVYVGNIAWAHIQAAKAMKDPEKVKCIRGKFYFISDDTPHLSYSDLNYELTKELGFGIEAKLPMPFTILYYYALFLEVVSFLLKPFVRYTPTTSCFLVVLMNTPFTFSYRKAQRDFGYFPRYTWQEAKQRVCQWVAKIAPQRAEYLKNKAV